MKPSTDIHTIYPIERLCDNNDYFGQYTSPDWKNESWYRMMPPAGKHTLV